MKIGVFFGSRSTEHDVSITSAFVIMKWLSRIPGYEVVPVYITREGRWMSNASYTDIKNLKNLKMDHTISIDTGKMDGKMHLEKKGSGFFSKCENITIDVAFHVIHGTGGEDGSLQGLSELLDVPYVGPGILGGALTLDKTISKDLFRIHDFPILPYRVIGKGKKPDLADIAKKLSFPLFVKPYNLGSSIGISRVTDAEGLTEAIEVAQHYAPEVIIEKAVTDLIELNCAVCRNEGKIITTLVEEIANGGHFLSFDKKYIVDREGGGTMSGNAKKIRIPAEIPENIRDEVYALSKRAFEIFRLSGAPRIDYLYDTALGKVYINEINPVPGALQMHLWEKSGIDQKTLLQILIDTALLEAKERKRDITFSSNILDHTISFVK